jgi:hypothetical protein
MQLQFEVFWQPKLVSARDGTPTGMGTKKMPHHDSFGAMTLNAFEIRYIDRDDPFESPPNQRGL